MASMKHGKATAGLSTQVKENPMATLRTSGVGVLPFKGMGGKRARGGRMVAPKMPLQVAGISPPGRGDRRGRKRGGSVGADTSPLTTANRLTQPSGGGEDN